MKVRTPQRSTKKIIDHFVGMVATCEPITFVKTMNIEDGERWKEATNKEINSLKNIDTWELEPLPKGTNLVNSKWVFQIK
jgi:hypothetical protein